MLANLTLLYNTPSPLIHFSLPPLGFRTTPSISILTPHTYVGGGDSDYWQLREQLFRILTQAKQSIEKSPPPSDRRPTVSGPDEGPSRSFPDAFLVLDDRLRAIEEKLSSLHCSDTDLTPITNRLITISNDISSLRDSLSSLDVLRSRIDALSSTLEDLLPVVDAVKSLSEDIEALKEDLRKLRNDLNIILKSLGDLNARVSYLAEKADLFNRVSPVEPKPRARRKKENPFDVGELL